MEFSAESLISSPSSDPEQGGEALEEIARAIQEHGLADILGLGVNYSDFVEGHRPSDDTILLERTHPEERANVLRFEKSSVVGPLQSIATKWQPTCHRTAEGRVVWSAKVECACTVAPGGGHLGTHTYIPPPPPPPPPPVFP